LHHFVIPPASVYAISRLAGHFFQLHVPLWAVILASVLSFPAVITFGILYNLRINEREAAKHGAILSACEGDEPGVQMNLYRWVKGLGLTPRDTRWSESVLREFGNLSSASLFFVLKAAFADSAPSGYWWMSSFGAGFSCHGALLEVS